MRIRMQGTRVPVIAVILVEEVPIATAQHNWRSRIDMDVDMEMIAPPSKKVMYGPDLSW